MSDNIHICNCPNPTCKDINGNKNKAISIISEDQFWINFCPSCMFLHHAEMDCKDETENRVNMRTMVISPHKSLCSYRKWIANQPFTDINYLTESYNQFTSRDFSNACKLGGLDLFTNNKTHSEFLARKGTYVYNHPTSKFLSTFYKTRDREREKRDRIDEMLLSRIDARDEAFDSRELSEEYF